MDFSLLKSASRPHRVRGWPDCSSVPSSWEWGWNFWDKLGIFRIGFKSLKFCLFSLVLGFCSFGSPCQGEGVKSGQSVEACLDLMRGGEGRQLAYVLTSVCLEDRVVIIVCQESKNKKEHQNRSLLDERSFVSRQPRTHQQDTSGDNL